MSFKYVLINVACKYNVNFSKCLSLRGTREPKKKKKENENENRMGIFCSYAIETNFGRIELKFMGDNESIRG